MILALCVRATQSLFCKWSGIPDNFGSLTEAPASDTSINLAISEDKNTSPIGLSFSNIIF